MKRVLIFSLAYYPHVGGAEVAIKEITDRITDIEFHLIALNFSGEAKEEKIGNVQIHRVGHGASYLQKILFIPRAVAAAARLHRAAPFDALWAMMSYMVFPIVLLGWKGTRLPYLLTLQEGDPWEHMFSRWFILPFRPLLSYGFRHAAAVQAISTYLAQWAKRMGYRSEPVVVPNGVDTALFAGAPTPHEGIVLITTSRLVHKNAVDNCIRALPLLPEVRLRVLGTGPDEPLLRQLAEHLRVANRVEFFGYAAHNQLPAALHAADIFIRPSRSEGMGISFVEAMAAGIPVIATQEGGIADFLFDAKRNPEKPTTGWAVDVNSPEQIANAVRNILAHPDETARVTATAKQMVIEKYDWNLIAHQMKEVLNTVRS